MPAQAQDREHLGRLLVGRRVEIDSKYRNRRTFAAERGIEYHLAYRVERSAQPTFEEATKAVIEKAYGLASGSFDRSLATGKLERADAAPDGQPQPESRADLKRQALDALDEAISAHYQTIEAEQAKIARLVTMRNQIENLPAGAEERVRGPRAL